MQQTKKMNYPKPPLILKEKDLLKGIDNPSEQYAINLRTDLVSVYQCMIDNGQYLNIDLCFYEHKDGCKTYRCVCGWWAYWLGIPILTDQLDYTDRFQNIFWNMKFFLCFKEIIYFSTKGEKISMFDLFFGTDHNSTLAERLTRARYLEISNKLKK